MCSSLYPWNFSEIEMYFPEDFVENDYFISNFMFVNKH